MQIQQQERGWQTYDTPDPWNKLCTILIFELQFVAYRININPGTKIVNLRISRNQFVYYL